MSALDLSWRLLKAPVYDTDISGIRFVTQGKDEADWSKDPTVYGADMGPLSHVPEEEDVLGDIRMITPNQFLAMTSKEGMDESSPYYGDIPVPVHYTDARMTNPNDPYFSPDVIDFPPHNKIETGEPMDLSWRLLKGVK
jgi:hypothetical protein